MKLGQVVLLYLPFPTFPVLKFFLKSCDFCLRISSSEGSDNHSLVLLVHRYYGTSLRSTVGSTELNYTAHTLGLDVIQKVEIQLGILIRRFWYHFQNDTFCDTRYFKTSLNYNRNLVSLQHRGFMLLMIQMRISSKPPLLHSRPLQPHPWCKMRLAFIFLSTLM